MKREELQFLTEQYISKRVHSKKEQNLLQKLLLGENETSFMTLWISYNGDYETAVRESVKSDPSNKQTTIERYKKFIDFLRRTTSEKISIEWPSIDVSSRLDRLIYIMRILQTNPKNAVQFLSDKLWMSTRTIEKELAALQYEDATDPVNFLDQSLIINGIRRSNKSISFLSSVHPMFLMENLTSVVVMIQALLEKAQTPAYKEWAMITAGHAWNQLTDYAKKKVEKMIPKTYDADSPVIQLFEELKTSATDGKFLTEQEVAKNVRSSALYACKTEEAYRYYCQMEDGTITEHTGTPFNIGRNDDTIRIRHQDGTEETICVPTVIRVVRVKG